MLYADIAPVPDEKEITLNIQGAFLEALGTSYALFGTESPQNPSRFEVISIYSAFFYSSSVTSSRELAVL